MSILLILLLTNHVIIMIEGEPILFPDRWTGENYISEIDQRYTLIRRRAAPLLRNLGSGPCHGGSSFVRDDSPFVLSRETKGRCLISNMRGIAD
jgi:hypothetical protein